MGEAIGGGLAVTGNYPGKARTPGELRADIDKALSLIPGTHRLNLHASYAETAGKWSSGTSSPRALSPLDRLGQGKAHRDGLQPHLFRPPQGRGLTLAHPDDGIRRSGSSTGSPAGDRGRHRRGTRNPVHHQRVDPRRVQGHPRRSKRSARTPDRSLDAVFAEPIDPQVQQDAVEGKLFGLGSESYVVGSHEFYLGYAVSRNKLLCLDAGHFHPTEVISDKLSAVFCWLDEVLLHVSRGVRWDSDHVVTLTDELQAIAQELVRGDYLGRVHIGLDFFDASINRVAAWVIGTRAMLKALLIALLEPTKMLREREAAGTHRTAVLLEELKTFPAGPSGTITACRRACR